MCSLHRKFIRIVWCFVLTIIKDHASVFINGHRSWLSSASTLVECRSINSLLRQPFFLIFRILVCNIMQCEVIIAKYCSFKRRALLSTCKCQLVGSFLCFWTRIELWCCFWWHALRLNCFKFMPVMVKVLCLDRRWELRRVWRIIKEASNSQTSNLVTQLLLLFMFDIRDRFVILSFKAIFFQTIVCRYVKLRLYWGMLSSWSVCIVWPWHAVIAYIRYWNIRNLESTVVETWFWFMGWFVYWLMTFIHLIAPMRLLRSGVVESLWVQTTFSQHMVWDRYFLVLEDLKGFIRIVFYEHWVGRRNRTALVLTTSSQAI